MLALALGLVASSVIFWLERAALQHSDRVILRQDAVQSSLVLSSYVGQVPPAVTELVNGLKPTSVNSTGWWSEAASVGAHAGYSSLAVLKSGPNGFVVVGATATPHGQFGGPGDAPLIAALGHGHSPYAGTVVAGQGRWLTELMTARSAPGYFVYTEQPVSNRPVDLASLPGRPFSGIQGAVYAGYERPEDLVFSSTAHLPLRGERAVTGVSGSNPFASNPASLTSKVGALSNPGGFILVISPTRSLSGTTASWLPWILLAIGLIASLTVAVLLFRAENRRSRMSSIVDQLEARNADLDAAMNLQQSTAARFSAMVRSSSDLTTVISADGQIRYQSPSSLSLLGLRPDALLGTGFPDLIHPGETETWHQALTTSEALPGTEVTAVLRLRTADGSYVWVETRVTNLLDHDAVSGIVLNSRDITDQQRLQGELRHQAFHDSLTGLANRALFEDRLDNAVKRLGRTSGTLGVLFLDVDDFKAVNDGRGHKVGDELLQAVSTRLQATVRAGDTLARLGGDEFAMIVEAENEAQVREAGQRLLAAFERPIPLGAGEILVRVSIGAATAHDADERAAHDLLRDADIAMYAAKNAGKGRIEVFHPGLHAALIGRLQLEVDMGRAVSNRELEVLYQPLVDLASGATVGMEALMRWEHPQWGTVMPADFIPVAESTGLIVSMGEWLLHQACRDARMVQVHGGQPEFHLAVNLSTKQLDDSRIVDQVRSALAQSGLPPHRLTLELTESLFMADRTRSSEVLAELKRIGVRLSIDDFGTGFSSLGYLNRLPVDELKIDRSFVAEAQSSDPDGTGTLVHTVVRLARDLGLSTVAEGIETEAQLDLVRQAGCQLVQGFLFSRPVGIHQFLDHVAGPAADRRRSEPQSRAPAPA